MRRSPDPIRRFPLPKAILLSTLAIAAPRALAGCGGQSATGASSGAGGHAGTGSTTGSGSSSSTGTSTSGAGTTTGSTTATTSASTSGGAVICSPGMPSACYDGPPGTEGMGACMGGTHVCDATGMGYGPCMGEVTPPCMGGVDGGGVPTLGSYQWGKNVAGPQDAEGNAVAFDAFGNVFSGGYINATIDFGCGPLTAAGGGNSAVVIKYDSSGTCVWSKRFGDPAFGNARLNGLATDAAGDVYIVGEFSQSIDLGGGTLKCAGGFDTFAAKLDGTGKYLWGKAFGDASDQIPTRVTVDPTGNVLMTGSFAGTIDFGGGTLTSAGAKDVFVAKLNPSGGHLWSKGYGGPGNEIGNDVATDGSGNVLLIGVIGSNANFGGGTLTSAGLSDIFVAKLKPSGDHLWSKRYGDASDQAGVGIASDAAGNVIVGGWFQGAVDFGGGSVTTAGGDDMWVAKLDGAGSYQWQATASGPGNQRAYDLGVDGAGNVIVTGGFFTSIDFGGGHTLTSQGSIDMLFAKYTAAGKFAGATQFGDSALQFFKAIAVDPAGNMAMTGLNRGVVNFGGGPLGGGGTEAFCTIEFGP